MFTDVFSWPAFYRLPVKLPEDGTHTHLWHDMFTYLSYNERNAYAVVKHIMLTL